MSKKVLGFLLIFTLVLTLSAPTFAVEKADPVYFNLGDSIAFGMNATDWFGYSDRYAEYLEDDYKGTVLEPVAVPGMTSLGLWSALLNPHDPLYDDVNEGVANANVITISIGGNNLLGQLMDLLSNGGANSMSAEDLTTLVKSLGEENWYQALAFLTAESAHDGQLGSLFEAGSKAFVDQWPQILDAIKEINPDAVIFVLTLYNPFSKADTPVLYNRFEELLGPMNKALQRSQSNCQLVHVYNAFNKNDDAVDFNLMFDELNLDPHPSEIGHQIIADLLMHTRNPKSFK